MYSLPTSATLAAFTMASAASHDPMSPTVSIISSASCDIGVVLRAAETVAHTAAVRLPDWRKSCYDPSAARGVAPSSRVTLNNSNRMMTPPFRQLVLRLSLVPLAACLRSEEHT